MRDHPGDRECGSLRSAARQSRPTCRAGTRGAATRRIAPYVGSDWNAVGATQTLLAWWWTACTATGIRTRDSMAIAFGGGKPGNDGPNLGFAAILCSSSESQHRSLAYSPPKSWRLARQKAVGLLGRLRRSPDVQAMTSLHSVWSSPTLDFQESRRSNCCLHRMLPPPGT